MSYLSSLLKIKNKILQKQICVLTGNVDDFMMINDLDLKEICNGNNLITLPQYLAYTLCNVGFKDIKYFNPSLGVIKSQNGCINIKDLEPENNICHLSFEDFLLETKEEVELIKKSSDNSVKKAFIIDFSEILCSYMNVQLSAHHISELIASFASIFDKSIISYLEPCYKLILICRNKNLLNQLFLTKNNEICFHNIFKPDITERKKFISKFSDIFNFKNNYNLLDINELENAAAITNNLSFREIFQMIRINQYYIVDNFKSLYNLVTFNKKESEWEKFDQKKIKSLTTFLSERVKGQNEAIEQIKQTIIRSYVGLSGIAQSSKNNKPKGILFFAGPTGVGKTELAKSLTEFVFGDDTKFIRFDMSEYNLEHSDQKLIGAPPGYVGYESGGQLTNAVREKPFSILLFDEIEKAHEKILDKFLQILEDGRLTSSKGELIDFSETFIIFTSNIGSDCVDGDYSNHIQNRRTYIKAIKEYFINRLNRPEILNRIGIKNIVPFNHIVDDEVIKEIILYKFNILKEKLLVEKNIKLNHKSENDFSSLITLIKKSYQIRLGGRGLVVAFEHVFIDELVNFIFLNIPSTSSKDSLITSVDYWVNNEKLFFEIKQENW